MRLTKEDKTALKTRMLREALPALKTMGSHGAPVDKIMRRAGVTSGALYSHFKSKDDFFAKSILHELDAMAEKYTGRVAKHGAKTLEMLVENYLDERHIDGVEQGCLFVSLGADMHRFKPAVRAQFEEKITALFRVLADALPKGTPAARYDKVSFIFASLAGTLLFARNMKNRDTARDLFTTTRHQLLHFLKKE
ncbi:MAG: TetR/AcrR family transcriptional regulator [Micavibrio sp.]|nr:TetR/AcrR family transcriptional regulator [Micavibrio sp.]